MKQLNKLFSAKSTRMLLLSFLLALLPIAVNAQCPDNNHPHMIDLGLPSGTKWACCNVGAQKPEESGGYFAWGETEEKSTYNQSTYIHFDGLSHTYKDIGNDIAGTQYDTATANWGDSWVMPSLDQIKELLDNCTSVWTTENGLRFTASNGTFIFLPAAGNRWDDDLRDAGSYGNYWSSSLVESYKDNAKYLYFFSSGYKELTDYPRCYGYSVRPVATGSSASSGIAIDATNFPDENFRNWVLAQDYGQDGVLTDEEIAGVTEINVYSQTIADIKGIEYFTALTTLDCGRNELTSLDVSKNTALTELWCYGNQLTSLDVSNNTALTELNCSENQLTSLDVSENTALTFLDCSDNQLTSLDVSNNTALKTLFCNSNQLASIYVSKNTALTELYCNNNQLTSLDVSKNTALTELWCNDNQLTILDVSRNTALTQLWCGYNQINATEMGNLVESLPTNNGELYVKYLNDANEQNVITTTQVAAAKAKGWKVFAWDSNAGDYGDWVEYDGDEPQDITPVEQGETIDIGTELDENTNLDGNVVGDVYYCISSGDGSYDPEEGCIVVTKPTEDSAIDGKDIFGEDFKDGYTGFVFMVAPGKGTINVEAETTGNMKLKVRVGDNTPTQMEVNGKTKVSFSYDMSEPTFVFIYGSIGAAGAKGMRKAAGTDALKIYGIEVTSETNGIKDIKDERLKMKDSPVYNLNGQQVEGQPMQKGVYIKNGKKVMVK